VPTKRAGSKDSPSIGHSNPVLRPATGTKGKSDTTSPACVSSARTGGAIKTTSSSASKMQGRSARTNSV